jgi:hypothetical protein
MSSGFVRRPENQPPIDGEIQRQGWARANETGLAPAPPVRVSVPFVREAMIGLIPAGCGTVRQGSAAHAAHTNPRVSVHRRSIDNAYGSDDLVKPFPTLQALDRASGRKRPRNQATSSNEFQHHPLPGFSRVHSLTAVLNGVTLGGANEEAADRLIRAACVAGNLVHWNGPEGAAMRLLRAWLASPESLVECRRFRCLRNDAQCRGRLLRQPLCSASGAAADESCRTEQEE